MTLERRPDVDVEQVVLGGISAKAVVVVPPAVERVVRGVLKPDLGVEPGQIVDLENGALRGRLSIGAAEQLAGCAGVRPRAGRGGRGRESVWATVERPVAPAGGRDELHGAPDLALEKVGARQPR